MAKAEEHGGQIDCLFFFSQRVMDRIECGLPAKAVGDVVRPFAAQPGSERA
jgi:hypothetical protein